MNFEAKRISKNATFSLAAPPKKVFPLLCPKRELEWVPGWEYEMVYSKSGYNEAGCIFKTHKPYGSEMIWTTVGYDPENFSISFLNVAPGLMIFDFRIRLAETTAENCETTIEQIFTGLSQEGNRLIAKIAEPSNNSGTMIEKPLNHYLKTGSKIKTDIFAHFHSNRY